VKTSHVIHDMMEAHRGWVKHLELFSTIAYPAVRMQSGYLDLLTPSTRPWQSEKILAVGHLLRWIVEVDGAFSVQLPKEPQWKLRLERDVPERGWGNGPK
jgi:hypothetical protein